MYDFQYLHFPTLDETLEYLRTSSDNCLIAGGTDVIIQYRSGKQAAKNLVNVLLPELIGIFEEDRYYRIGASTPLTEVSDYFSLLPPPYRVIHTAAESVGSCQTRNLGTVGGNICTGNASSDMATAFLVLDAQAVACSAVGERIIPMTDFFIKNRCTALRPDELLKEILIPKEEALNSAASFIKLGKRRGHVIATLNVAALIAQDENGIIRKARLAGGTLAPRPIRFFQSELLLEGCSAHGPAFEAALEEMAASMLTEMQPRDSKRGSKEYRIHASQAVMKDAVVAACNKEG